MEVGQGGTKTPSLSLEVELGPPFQTYAKPGAEKSKAFSSGETQTEDS